MERTDTLPSAVTVAGDFEAFFRDEYTSLVRALALLTGGDQAEAEDLAQEAMARVYERWDRVARMLSPTGYAFQVARNLHRRRSRLRLRPTRPTPFGERAHHEDPTAEAGSRTDVRRALLSLPPRDRELLVLLGVLGLSQREAAAALGVSEGALRVRLHRARAALRDRFEVSDG